MCAPLPFRFKPDLGLDISLSGGGSGSLQTPTSITLPAGQSSASITVTGQSIGQASLVASAPRRTSASLDFTIVSGLEISGLNPSSGEPGSLIEIQGNAFDPVPANNAVVFFGNGPTTSTVVNIAANVITASATRLTVKTRAGVKSCINTFPQPYSTAWHAPLRIAPLRAAPSPAPPQRCRKSKGPGSQ